MKHLSLLKLSSLLLVVLLCLWIRPLAAQDVTAEPDAALTAEATLESAPVTILTGDSGSVDVNVQAPPPADTSNTVPTPVVVVAAALVGIVFLGFFYNQQVIIKVIAPLVPLESAQGLIDALLPALTSAVVNAVTPVIPGDIDDTLFIAAARQRGLTVARGNDGLYHTTRTPSASTDPTLPSRGVNREG
jgi:hypothetical protein